jgi:recombination protein RecR
MNDSTPTAVELLIRAFSRLPGIGRKSAQRVAYHLLKSSGEETDTLIRALSGLRHTVHQCQQCFNFAEADLCVICQNTRRDTTTICVVEEPPDISPIEKTSEYRGLYHVLGGVLSPLDNIGPDELHIRPLLERLRSGIKEVIVAVNPTTEGDATTHYLAHVIKPLGIKVTRLARGLPAGGSLEYADDITISNALKGRVDA